MKKDIESLFTRAEIRRLELAARDKNKIKLAEWAGQFEEQVRMEYEKKFQEELADSIDNFILTIVYVLHYNESTRFGKKRLDSFMQDLLATVDNFNNKTYSPEDYRKELAEDGIIVVRKGSE